MSVGRRGRVAIPVVGNHLDALPLVYIKLPRQDKDEECFRNGIDHLPPPVFF